MTTAPSADELHAYRRGDLPPDRFAAIDSWLADQPAEDQARLLAGVEEPGTHATAGSEDGTFRPLDDGDRYRIEGELGRGGMGVVLAATDTRLQRPVAIKRLRPRDANEDLGSYALRLRLFRREASLLAGLEHPGIVTVHDVGAMGSSEPAYVMRRLEGMPGTILVTQAGCSGPEPARAAEIVLRIAEAVGYAHSKGIVHRDLKPDNVWVGSHGDVAVIDWGLAGRFGDQGDTVPAIGPATQAGVGTPAWMAPEQEAGEPADPRMDVFGLGALLHALLTGRPPRQQGAIDLTGLEARGIPKGLAAVVRRCCQTGPDRRYADGDAVARDLTRWFAAGITNAQDAGLLRRGWAALHARPRLAAILATLILALAVMACGQWYREHLDDLDAAREAGRIVAETPVEDEAALRVGLRHLDALLADHPGLAPLREARARLQATHESLAARERTAAQARNLRSLARRFLLIGPWSEEITDLRNGLTNAGIDLAHPAIAGAAIATSPLRRDQLLALTQLARALILAGERDQRFTALTDTLRATGLPSWSAMGDLLDITESAAHDLRLCQCAASEGALADPETADALLAAYASEPRLADYSRSRIAVDPGAFWPRVVLARSALAAGDPVTAEREALVALGAEPDSLWPHLTLAYAALVRADDDALRREARAAMTINASNLEAAVLLAVAEARDGDRVAAQVRIDQLDAAGHLQYHLQHPVGHPMEASVAALVAAGLHIPAADPVLGPVTPHHH